MTTRLLGIPIVYTQLLSLSLSRCVPVYLIFRSMMDRYLRPETAICQVVQFERLLNYNNQKMPFASAAIGRVYRNEISPRAQLLRTRYDATMNLSLTLSLSLSLSLSSSTRY
jgi:hypothetical protein